MPLRHITLLLGAASALASPTCDAVKDAYHTQECCEHPDRPFQFPATTFRYAKTLPPFMNALVDASVHDAAERMDWQMTEVSLDGKIYGKHPQFGSDVLAMVNNSEIDMVWGGVYDLFGANNWKKSMQLANAAPFALSQSAHLLYAKRNDWFPDFNSVIGSDGYTNVKVLSPCLYLPAESVLWSKKKLETPDDMNITTDFRAFGLPMDLFEDAFPRVTMTGGPTLDGFKHGDDVFAEYNDPYIDNVQQDMLSWSETYLANASNALYYYTQPAITSASSASSIFINADLWNALDAKQRNGFETMCAKSVLDHWRYTDAQNQAMIAQYKSAGVKVERLPDSIVDHLRHTWTSQTSFRLGFHDLVSKMRTFGNDMEGVSAHANFVV